MISICRQATLRTVMPALAQRLRRVGLLGEALIAMKREAEARPLLLKSYTSYARTYGEQNPSSTRARRRLDQLDTPTRSP